MKPAEIVTNVLGEGGRAGMKETLEQTGCVHEKDIEEVTFLFNKIKSIYEKNLTFFCYQRNRFF